MNITTKITRLAAAFGVSAALFVPLLAIPAHAQITGTNNLTSGTVSQSIEASAKDIRTASSLSTKSLPVMIGSIIRAVLTVLGILLVIYFIYAGFLWMTAGGDSKQIDTAKTIMKNATIGLAVLLASYSIAEFVLNAILAGTGTT